MFPNRQVEYCYRPPTRKRAGPQNKVDERDGDNGEGNMRARYVKEYLKKNGSWVGALSVSDEPEKNAQRNWARPRKQTGATRYQDQPTRANNRHSKGTQTREQFYLCFKAAGSWDVAMSINSFFENLTRCVVSESSTENPAVPFLTHR